MTSKQNPLAQGAILTVRQRLDRADLQLELLSAVLEKAGCVDQRFEPLVASMKPLVAAASEEVWWCLQAGDEALRIAAPTDDERDDLAAEATGGVR